MPSAKFELHDEAQAEMDEAVDWFERADPAVADRFIAELQRAFRLIVEGPRQWPLYMFGTRRIILRKFRYNVVYHFDPSETRVRVIAIAHTSRRPGYWRDRR